MMNIKTKDAYVISQLPNCNTYIILKLICGNIYIYIWNQFVPLLIGK